MFWERFYLLCDKQHTKPNPIGEKLGFSSGSITKWKNGTVPNGEALLKIADYFNVSVDYLLGRTDYPEINNGKIIIDGETIDGTIHEISNGYIVTDPDAELTPEDIKEIRNIIENS